jgi:hypothetical protein
MLMLVIQGDILKRRKKGDIYMGLFFKSVVIMCPKIEQGGFCSVLQFKM